MAGMEPLETAQTLSPVDGAESEQPSDSTAPGFIPIKEAARLMGFSEKHVLRALQAGELSGLKLGDAYRVLRADVEEPIALAQAGNGLIVIGKTANASDEAEAVAS